MAGDPTQRLRRWAAWALLLLAVTVALWTWWRDGAARREAGAALFHGETALAGRLAGHTEALPTVATRCSNCHETLSTSAPSSYAVRLDRAWLTTPRQRRGGPPSAYDSAALCAVLRIGVDPVQVMVASTMPRYEASDAECGWLWSYLMSR